MSMSAPPPWLPEHLRGLPGLFTRRDVPVPRPDDSADKDEDESDEEEKGNAELDDPRNDPVVWRVGSSLFIEWPVPGIKAAGFGLGGLGLLTMLLSAPFFRPSLVTWIPGGIGKTAESAATMLPRGVLVGAGSLLIAVGVAMLIGSVLTHRHWRESVQVDRSSGKFILRWRAGWFVMYEYRYALADVREVRLSQSASEEDERDEAWSLWDHPEALWDTDGRLMFQYGAARVAFADGLSKRQATVVLTAVGGEAPELLAMIEAFPAPEPATGRERLRTI